MTPETLLENTEYWCKDNLELYDSPECQTLATQAAQGRHLRLYGKIQDNTKNSQAILVQLCEDDYTAWLSFLDCKNLEIASQRYQAVPWSETQIQAQLPQVIEFTYQAMQTPNQYLWGGTVSPNYDCSGLMQAAFGAVGIWLPRDAYQQEAFTKALPLSTESFDLSCLKPGDLVFFGTSEKATHVGLYLGEGRYIHSSGQNQGRNGIGIDVLSEQGDTVSQTYYQQLRGAGRVISSYQSLTTKLTISGF